MATRQITPEEKASADELLRKARVALKEIENYNQACVDRLCQAVAWGVANEKTFTRIAQMGADGRRRIKVELCRVRSYGRNAFERPACAFHADACARISIGPDVEPPELEHQR